MTQLFPGSVSTRTTRYVISIHTDGLVSNLHQLLLILDIQVGLYHIARDWDPSLYQNNIRAHAEIGKVFDLPVILSTSADTGPNGVRAMQCAICRNLSTDCISLYPKSLSKCTPTHPLSAAKAKSSTSSINPFIARVLTFPQRMGQP
jgi:hypothetical protein